MFLVKDPLPPTLFPFSVLGTGGSKSSQAKDDERFASQVTGGSEQHRKPTFTFHYGELRIWRLNSICRNVTLHPLTSAPRCVLSYTGLGLLA